MTNKAFPLDLCSLMLLALYLYYLTCLPIVRAQSSREVSARELDSILQDYAYRAFVRAKTGVPYDAAPPSNLTGIKLAAMRLRSGSLKRRGVSSYKEFHIPIGVTEQPYVERLVLVYHNLANWSELYYPLPGYTYLAPILGLLAYNGSDLSAKNLPELDIQASKEPIKMDFPDVQGAPEGLSPKCVHFGIDGSLEFDNVIGQNVCSTTKQGHFSIAVEYIAPASEPAPGPGDSGNSSGGGGGEKGKKKMWIIIGSVVGGLILIVLLGVIFACLKKCRDRKMIQRMEAAADRSEPLLMARVGDTKAPVAPETRTRPSLESGDLSSSF